MKKRIVSLLLAAATALALCTSALAYSEPAQFSDWLLSAAGSQEEAKEALASVGTVLGQSQTVNGVTLTLEGAVWNSKLLQLSFDIQGADIPKDIPSGTTLNCDSSRITMPEDQRRVYLSEHEEAAEKLLIEAGVLTKSSTQAERDADIQSQLSRGEPRLMHRFQLIRSGGKETLMMTVSGLDYVEQPELTVHLENLVIYQKLNPNDKFKTAFTLSGPYDFTFTLKKHLQPRLYKGTADVTVNKIPIEIEEITVTAFGAKLQYGAKQADTTSQQLEPIRLTGVWTKDGKFVKAAGAGENRAFDALKGVANAQGLVSNSHPGLLDPADVTAVSLGDIRVDLSKLTRLEKEPAILISGGTPDAHQEKAGSTQAEKADAGVPAEREQKLAEAKKIAYRDLKTASKEEQAKILEARKLIINSTSWVADGYNAFTIDTDGNRVPLPHFSELFPGWEMPTE
ncbi:MAG: hypothetical protein HFG07_06580 [Oscillibacter sp.]|nr:hypothetical protein [Oscillibacter sp.]